ncbi:MAG TPA: hypothetical protein VEJ63_04315 [Planctomycetota bacterium]|nr:hypothetical protein [Planctomycetota bacterium]
MSHALKASAKCSVSDKGLVLAVSNLKVRAPVLSRTSVRARVLLSDARLDNDTLAVRYKVLSALGLPVVSGLVSKILTWTGAGREYGLSARGVWLSLELEALRRKNLLPRVLAVEGLQLPTPRRRLLVLRFSVQPNA